ncbi:unnamed protein product [Pseudo-nitzschia multistriata]|uniref:CSD domain-containing protein n=1 Tax=Pseudo-nitzschia multistriata TaxID=183589 RepID=A0A448ZEY4_9STRA|nr:unnamed protein product [Pseudo-nitzschia multistriata]
MWNSVAASAVLPIVAGLLVAIDPAACFLSSAGSTRGNTPHVPGQAERPLLGRNAGSSGSGNTHLLALPRVIVFDLDNTLWTPELYQLRRLERKNQIPIAGRDVELFEGARQVLEDILPGLGGTEDEPKPMLAIASRTNKVDWAEDLLDQFQLRDRFDAIEIFPGIKTNHFAKIQRSTKVPFHEMMFFDDARDGRYGNCEPVAAMGVFCVHCPDGLNTGEVFERALDLYQNEWDKTPNTIVESNGEMKINVPRKFESPPRASSKTFTGVVKLVKREKYYGFIKYRVDHGKQRTKEIFFHFNNVATEPRSSIQEGDSVTFQIRKDYKNSNKDMAFNVDRVGGDEDSSDKALFRCFSMNNPFAAMLANGYKTLETRNGTMFSEYSEGTQMLLHVGQRTYPDGGKHLDIIRAAQPGISDEEIQTLKRMPKGFSKGNIVAIVEIGKTYEASLSERSVPDFERKVVAYGPDSGRIVTEIKRVAYLKRPIRQRGEAGVFNVKIDPKVLPDGWTIPTTSADTRVFEISG